MTAIWGRVGVTRIDKRGGGLHNSSCSLIAVCTAKFKRRRKMNKFRNLLAVVMLASLFLTACGSQATPAPTEAPAPTQAPANTQAPAATEAPTQGSTSGIDCAGAKS